MKPKAKRILKLTLDAVLFVLLALMYRKQVISITFHEIGGLALIALFILHHLVNGKWIAAVTKRLFARETGALARARYCVDALLLLDFLAVGVSGILISEVLFSFGMRGNVETLHTFTAALAIVLTGVHIGLHADYIFGKLLRKGGLKAAKIVCAVLLAALLAFGGYSLFTTSYVSYLTTPFRTAAVSSGEAAFGGSSAPLEGQDGQSEFPNEAGGAPAGENPGSDAALPSAENSDETAPGSSDAALPSAGSSAETAPVSPDDGFDGSHGGGQGAGGGQHQGNGQGLGEGNGRGGERSVGAALLLIANYLGIAALFAAVTYLILRLFRRKPKKQGLAPACGPAPLPEPAQEAGEADASTDSNGPPAES